MTMETLGTVLSVMVIVQAIYLFAIIGKDDDEETCEYENNKFIAERFTIIWCVITVLELLATVMLFVNVFIG